MSSRHRIARVLGLIVFAASAMLVFPSRIPEFAGIWLLLILVWGSRKNGATMSLWLIPVWLLVKGPELTVPFWFFLAGVVLFAAFAVSMVVKKSDWLSLFAIWLLWWFHHHAVEQVQGIPSGPIVCLGDSLTDFGYPQVLESKTEREVLDFGFNGYTTEDGIGLTPKIVSQRPAVVVIELGGHDYKNGESREATAQRLREMIVAFQEGGSNVVLVAIPRGFINDPWNGLESELARKHGLAIVPDTMIRRLVFWSPIFPPGSLVPKSWHLSKDGLHPNEKGNKMMAGTIADALDIR